jgi:hypothetical protein
MHPKQPLKYMILDQHNQEFIIARTKAIREDLFKTKDFLKIQN